MEELAEYALAFQTASGFNCSLSLNILIKTKYIVYNLVGLTMSHKNQLDNFQLVKTFYPQYFEDKRILEVGSLNLNGTIRIYFNNCEYIGCDVAEGKDVDVASPGQLLDFPTEHFDLVTSTECFEHNPFWIETLSNMLRMMKTNGMIVITCASLGRGEHGTMRTSPENSPLTSAIGWTYYQNLSKRDFRIINLGNWLRSYFIIEGGTNNDLVLIGFGKDSSCKITKEFERAIKTIMKYNFRAFILALLNGVIGNKYFQELYMLIRKNAPFLLRSKPPRKL